MLVKAYGLVDLTAAGILYLSDLGRFDWLKALIIVVLVFKAIPSVMA